MTGLECALCAWAFYRGRHQRTARYKHPSRAHALQTQGHRAAYVAAARFYIQEARRLGWRGSFRQAVLDQAFDKFG